MLFLETMEKVENPNSNGDVSLKYLVTQKIRTRKPTVIATDSFSMLLAASGNRWTRNPKTRNIRKLIDDSRNQINLIWVHTTQPRRNKWE
jgi:archaellum biogenesis ATPase FlaH